MAEPFKPKERRQRRNSKPGRFAVVVPLARSASVPACPPGFLDDVEGRWLSFWSSDVANAVDRQSDMPAVIRLFTLYDERERGLQSFRRERLVRGSQGQVVLNPIGRLMAAWDAEIRQLEDRFGLTPLSRLKLGLTFSEAQRTLEDLTRSLDEADGDDGDDPRLESIPGHTGGRSSR